MKLQFAPYPSNKVVEHFNEDIDSKLNDIKQFLIDLKLYYDTILLIYNEATNTYTQIDAKINEINAIYANNNFNMNQLIQNRELFITQLTNLSNNIKKKSYTNVSTLANEILKKIYQQKQLYVNTGLVIENQNTNIVNIDNLFIRLLVLLKSLDDSLSKIINKKNKYNDKEIKYIKEYVYYSSNPHSERMSTSNTNKITLNIIKQTINAEPDSPKNPLTTILDDQIAKLIIKKDNDISEAIDKKKKYLTDKKAYSVEILNLLKSKKSDIENIRKTAIDGQEKEYINDFELYVKKQLESGRLSTNIKYENEFKAQKKTGEQKIIYTYNSLPLQNNKYLVSIYSDITLNKNNMDALLSELKNYYSLTNGWIKNEDGTYTNTKSGQTEFTLEGSIAVQEAFDKKQEPLEDFSINHSDVDGVYYTHRFIKYKKFTYKEMAIHNAIYTGKAPLEGWYINHSDVDGVYYTHPELELQKFKHKEMLNEHKSLNPSNGNTDGGLNNGSGGLNNGNDLITSGWVKNLNGTYTNTISGQTEFTLEGAIAVQEAFDNNQEPLEGWSINHSDVDGVYYTHPERESQKFTHKEMLNEDKSLNPSNENEKTGLIVGVTIGSIIFVGLVVFLVVKSKVLKKSTKKNKPKKKTKITKK